MNPTHTISKYFLKSPCEAGESPAPYSWYSKRNYNIVIKNKQKEVWSCRLCTQEAEAEGQLWLQDNTMICNEVHSSLK